MSLGLFIIMKTKNNNMKKITLAVILILSITTKLVAQQIHITSVSDTLGYLFDTSHTYHVKYIDSRPDAYTFSDLLMFDKYSQEHKHFTDMLRHNTPAGDTLEPMWQYLDSLFTV